MTLHLSPTIILHHTDYGEADRIVTFLTPEHGYDLGDGQFLKVTDRGVKYPVTPGHEIVGTIEELTSFPRTFIPRKTIPTK